MKRQLQQRTAFVFGVVFVVALLLLAIMFPNPTPFQYTVFRIVLSLAAAGVAAMIPGFLEVQVPGWIRAGGALAVFVIVYFYNPAEIVAQPPRNSSGDVPTAAELFRSLEDVDTSSSSRLQALAILRDRLGIRDFRGRNLSGLALPASGWENADLREADLRNVKLHNANMRGVDLVRAIMTGADVSGTDFRGAQLNGADISGGICKGVVFTEVWLRAGKYRGTDFPAARLEYANLEIADFTGAKFEDADMAYALAGEAIFSGADLSSTRNLSLAHLEVLISMRRLSFPWSSTLAATKWSDGKRAVRPSNNGMQPAAGARVAFRRLRGSDAPRRG